MSMDVQICNNSSPILYNHYVFVLNFPILSNVFWRFFNINTYRE